MNAAEPGRFCISCGAPLRPGDAFCTGCGRQTAPAVRYAVQPVGQARQRNTGAILTAFLILAVFAVLLFLLMKLPALAAAAGVAAVGVCCAVRLVIARRSLAATLGLWLGAAVLCFAVLVIFMPGKAGPGTGAALTAVVSPGEQDTTVAYGAISVVIPGGTVSKQEMLEIKPVSGLPKAMDMLEPVCPAFDVTLGSLTTFDKPIYIDIPYDSKKLGDADPAGGFIAVYYDEALKMWVDVPYEVDAEKGIARLIMNHLTTVQLYYSALSGYFTYQFGVVRVIYENTDSQQKSFLAYEKSATTPFEAGVPLFVSDAADIAATVYHAYKVTAKLTMPDSVNIYLTDGGNSYYKGLTGNIEIPADIGSGSEPKAHLQRDVAHELFHMAQDYTLSWYNYNATQLNDISFWLDATADYMGNTGAWLLLKRPDDYQPVSQYQSYDLDFFKTSLYSVEDAHDYQAAGFVSYLQQISPAEPKQMIDMALSDAPFPAAFDGVYGLGGAKTLEEWYRNFLIYSVSQYAPSFGIQLNSALESAVKNNVRLEFQLDENGFGIDTLPKEGAVTLTYNGAYTAGFAAFASNCDTTLTVTPGADVVLLRYDRTLKDLSPNLRVDAPAGVPTEVTFGKNSFYLALQVSPSAGALNIAYRALPIQKDLSGTWNVVSMVETDVEGPAEFWSAVQSSFGYDKASYMTEVNAKLQAEISSMYFLLTKAGGGAEYTVSFVAGAMDGEQLDFGTIQITDNIISGSTKFGDLWASTALTVSGDTITGTIRAQMAVTSGEQVYTATEVYHVTAVRAVSGASH